MKRHHMSKRHSRRSFTKHASHVHRKNLHSGSTMSNRGGIRL